MINYRPVLFTTERIKIKLFHIQTNSLPIISKKCIKIQSYKKVSIFNIRKQKCDNFFLLKRKIIDFSSNNSIENDQNSNFLKIKKINFFNFKEYTKFFKIKKKKINQRTLRNVLENIKKREFTIEKKILCNLPSNQVQFLLKEIKFKDQKLDLSKYEQYESLITNKLIQSRYQLEKLSKYVFIGWSLEKPNIIEPRRQKSIILNDIFASKPCCQSDNIDEWKKSIIKLNLVYLSGEIRNILTLKKIFKNVVFFNKKNNIVLSIDNTNIYLKDGMQLDDYLVILRDSFY